MGGRAEKDGHETSRRTAEAAPAAGEGEEMERRCELCWRAAARAYCEADEAALCWACDARVHGANFLVARHPRALLCRACRSPTPWRAAGPRLRPAASFCSRCCCRDPAMRFGDRDLAGSDEAGGEVQEEKEGEEGENQVVPWPPSPPPPPVSSSSSSEESLSRSEIGSPRGGRAAPLKRGRDSADSGSQIYSSNSTDEQQRLRANSALFYRNARTAADE